MNPWDLDLMENCSVPNWGPGDFPIRITIFSGLTYLLICTWVNVFSVLFRLGGPSTPSLNKLIVFVHLCVDLQAEK